MVKDNKRTINRRQMIKGLGMSAAAGATSFPGTGTMFAGSEGSSSRFQKAEPMKITKIESIRFNENLKIGGGSGGNGSTEFCWIRIHTNTGIVGIGETYPSINGELGSLKDIAKDYLIGKDPRDIEKIWKGIYKYQAMRNAGGSEMHMQSAIDMALLDIIGKTTGQPLYRLLGGKTRSKVRVYNTTTNNMKMGADTEKIVTFLLERGITAIKIYPFRSEGGYISTVGIDNGIEWLRQIDKTAGKKMEILIDGWGGFDVPAAQRIIKACEKFNVIHIEDILMPNSAQSYKKLAEESSIPIAHSEVMATRYQLKDFLEAGAVDILMFDICWCGGVTEAKKMCDMADAYLIPASPHTCGGPLLYVASAHLCTAIQNFSYMESNYWKYTHQFPYFVNSVPVPVDGYITAPEGPGLGVEIKEELFKNGDAIVELIAEI